MTQVFIPRTPLKRLGGLLSGSIFFRCRIRSVLSATALSF